MSSDYAKLVLLGEAAVGKSAIVQRFLHGDFDKAIDSTIGAAYSKKQVHLGPGRQLNLRIWDTAGQERYRSIAPMYYRGAHASLVVYDITSRPSYERALSWVKELCDSARTVDELGEHPIKMVIALVGNKSDLKGSRAVKRSEAEGYAKMHGLLFSETSAKENSNVDLVFSLVAAELAKHNDFAADRAESVASAPKSVSLKESAETKKGPCC